MKPLKCKCGKGYASQVDKVCKCCRVDKYSCAQCKSVRARDGMSLAQEAVLLGIKKRSEVWM